jgi:methionyl-tRNA formyltransferase
MWDRYRERRASSPQESLPSLAETAKKYSLRVVQYDCLNSGQMLVDLMKCENEVTILGGCGIVSREIISLAKKGCVNGHPALLPGARGVDVIEWSIIKGLPIGVTAHKVVKAVDAGPLLRTESVSAEANETLPDFKQRIEGIQARVLADATLDVLWGTENATRNDPTNSELFFVTNRRQRREAERLYATRLAS